MPGPREGIRVVEMGFWVAGPGAAGILADWGADVVKIEPPEGDPFPGMFMSVVGMDAPFNPPFELDNRGTRSAALNLQHPDGRAVRLDPFAHRPGEQWRTVHRGGAAGRVAGRRPAGAFTGWPGAS